MLDKSGDNAIGDAKIVQVNDRIRRNVKKRRRTRDVSHHHFFADTCLGQLEDVFERRGGFEIGRNNGILHQFRRRHIGGRIGFFERGRTRHFDWRRRVRLKGQFRHELVDVRHFGPGLLLLAACSKRQHRTCYPQHPYPKHLGLHKKLSFSEWAFWHLPLGYTLMIHINRTELKPRIFNQSHAH